MNINISFLFILILILTSSCEKEPEVWTVVNNVNEDFTVFVNNERFIVDEYETITGEFDADECVDIEIWNGYLYPATRYLVKSRSMCSTSSISINSYDLNNGGGSGSGSGGSGGTGGGGTGGGSGYGDATIWTQSDMQCGNITVNVSNYGSKTISSYYSSGLSYCDASGCANYYLPVGTYNYTASCTDYNWSGTITINEDACFRLKLTL